MKFHFLSMIAFFTAGFANAEICKEWSDSVQLGVLTSRLIEESSGMEVSSRFPDRIYHVNDSGDGPRLYLTDLRGDQTRMFYIEDFAPVDPEALASGPCLVNSSCLFVGDIGDNSLIRQALQLIVLEEKDWNTGSIEPLRRVRMTYPDGPHNAEAMALHPNGDLFIVTKEYDYSADRALPARIYKLEKKHWESKDQSRPKPLTFVGELDLPRLAKNSHGGGQIVTDMDLSADGKKIILLTYQDAFEFQIDLANEEIKPAAQMTKGKDYLQIDLFPYLKQQETIAYLPGDQAFIYSTESHHSDAPLMKKKCKTPSETRSSGASGN